MKRLGLLTVVLVAAACGPAPNLLPVDDLNRPTDVAFMCFGAFPTGTGTDGGVPDGGATGPLQVSGRPIGACHPPNQYDPGPTSTTRTFAFLPNSAAGTLSVVDADHWKLVDLNLDTAGYGTAPLGQLPAQISASDDGCRLISANRGSCDLTLVDPSVLVAPAIASQNAVDVTLASPRTGAQTFRPLKGDGTPLLAAPYEAVFLPQNTGSLLSYPTGNPNNPYQPTPPSGVALPLQPVQNALCGDSAAVDPNGWPAQPAPKSWYALVTYPSCDLITVVALPSGKIVSSAKVVPVRSSDGKHDSVMLQDTGTSPVCPIAASDCVGQAISPQAAAAASSDAAAGDGPQHAPPGDAGGDAGLSDAAADAGGPTGTDGSATGVGGSTGAGGASTGTGGASTGTGGAAGSTDAGATGGAGGQGGSPPGNQYDNIPYVGTAPLGPSGIAIVPDGSRAYISLGNASYVLSIGLTSAGLSLPGNNIYLNEGARGSTRVRLNVDPTRSKTGAYAGVFVGAETGTTIEPAKGTNFAGLDPERQYLYVIARDGTLRVVSVYHPGAETECETNADPLNLPPGVTNTTQCIPVDSDYRYRRPFSVGPGIHFSSLPIDVAAADIQRQPTDTGEQSVNGAHAWVITDSGIVYLVNINPILRDHQAVYLNDATGIYESQPVTEPFPFINTLRDRNEITFQVTLDPSSGPPRVDVPPPVPPTGPYIEPFWTRGSAINPTAVTGAYIETSVFFPQVPMPPNLPSPNDPIDRRGITAQTWTVAWEGPLSGGRNTGKAYPAGQFSSSDSDLPSVSSWNVIPIPGIDSRFQDGGVNYCALGVVPGDMITLTGCIDNSQCGLGEQCVIGDTGSSAAAGLAVTGVCLDPNREGTQIPACQGFLNSLRRYEIVAAFPNNVIMRPHLDEIVLSSLTPECQPAGGVGTDGGVATDAGADGGVSVDTCPNTLDDPTTQNFTCQSSYPGGGGPRRCLMLCSPTNPCRAGRVCVDFGDGALGGQTCDSATGICPPSNGGANAGGDDAGAAAGTCADPNHRCFCADAPPFDQNGKMCFDQLVNYQVVAGKSFIVAGSQAGIVTTANVQPNGICDPPTTDPRFSFRISLNGPNAPRCTNVPDSVATTDSRVDPDFVDPKVTDKATKNANALQSFATSTPAPADPCLYLGGPVSGDPSSDSVRGMDAGADGGVLPPQHVRALFKNSQVSFVLANIDRGPTFQFATTFDVHGGFSPQLVQDPATVQISMPARIVIGPVDSLAQVTTGVATPAYEAPYLFVVDQRRLGGSQGGGPTRGQLVRINPFGYTSSVGSAPTGYQPIFDDYNASGGLFPIQ